MSSMFPSYKGIDLPPAVVVRSLAEALAALAHGLPVTLLSAPGAGAVAGAGWWRALCSAARAAHPDTGCTDVLDCADAPGRAMEAIRAGQAFLVLDPACPAFDRVAALAIVLPARPPALDLDRRDAQRHLRAWLAPRAEDDSRAPLR